MTTRDTLKTYFRKGAIPKASEFAELIDSVLIKDEDNLSQVGADPLSIKAATDGRLLNFYNAGQKQPTWQLTQKQDAPAGLSINSVSGESSTSRLLIDSATGNIGIGTTETDKAKLTVAGDTTLNGKLDVTKTLTVAGLIMGNKGAIITEEGTGTGTIKSEVSPAMAARGLFHILGNGTKFVKELRVGDQIFAENQMRSIRSIGDDQTLVIDRQFNSPLPPETSFRFSRPGLLVQNGNVGIGTSSPLSTLQIVGPRAFDSSTILHLTNGATDHGRTNLVLTSRFNAGNDAWLFGTAARNSIVFAKNAKDPDKDVGGLGVEQFSIQLEGNSNSLGFLTATRKNDPALVIGQNGHVGIGTTDLSHILTIVIPNKGTWVFQADGNLCFYQQGKTTAMWGSSTGIGG